MRPRSRADGPACCTATAPICCRTRTARSWKGIRSRPGLDYPGIGPEHAWLKDIGRAEYRAATDAEALEAFQLCSKLEGIIPALEPSHALARVGEIANEVGKGGDVVLNMCGRGDKDIFAVAKHLGVEL